MTEKIKGTAPSISQSQRISTDFSITIPAQKVNTLKQLRGERPAKDFVDLIQKKYPKYDETLQSKCEHTEEYGVCLCPGAMKMVIDEYGRLVTSTPEYRRLKNRISARLSDDDYKALKER